MAKVTEVYMMADGVQNCFTMQQFLNMRKESEEVAQLKFIPIDHRMYQASPAQFKAWRKQRNRSAYLSEINHGVTEVSYDAFLQDDDGAFFDFPDETIDVAEEATDACLFEAVHAALNRLTDKERELVLAIVVDGKSVREYAKEAGLAPMIVQDRKVRILAKLKKMLML